MSTDRKPSIAGRLRGGIVAALAAVIVLALMFVGGVARADTGSGSISSVATAQLPRLPEAGSLIGLATVNGRAVAIQASGAWILSEDGKQWVRAEWGDAAADAPNERSSPSDASGIRGVISD